MNREALPQAMELFPLERELKYAYGFDPETKELKISIYYKDTDTFIIAFKFNEEEEIRLKHLLLNN